LAHTYTDHSFAWVNEEGRVPEASPSKRANAIQYRYSKSKKQIKKTLLIGGEEEIGSRGLYKTQMFSFGCSHHSANATEFIRKIEETTEIIY